MRAILITLFLILSVVVAEEAEDAAIVETIDPAKEAGISVATNPRQKIMELVELVKSMILLKMLDGQPEAYESPRFKRFVTHCSSHVAETCSDPMHYEGGIRNPTGLSHCIFDSMKACLANHKASLYDSARSKTLNLKPTKVEYLPVIIQTVKFQTVLKTCSQVSAQSCLSDSDVDASTLGACLLPSLNQCVYHTQMPPLPPPPLPPPLPKIKLLISFLI
uniref:Uncharacterized protein n=1 Tax=Phaseolus vulgaris TaxID=3885 RepID=V7C0B9_PHAVU|nr:hypothetical protein PHAVU_005G176300g [Phaseolus vulgaris]ESW22725.1 hypothetical protein PHAVU_005G176300g [Phaseolus vulgaris]